jgi:hypothetical protein
MPAFSQATLEAAYQRDVAMRLINANLERDAARAERDQARASMAVGDKAPLEAQITRATDILNRLVDLMDSGEPGSSCWDTIYEEALDFVGANERATVTKS